MLIAKEKEKSNLAEYILYMWQIEDMVRFNEFDIDRIYDVIIDKFEATPEMKAEIKLWYENIIKNMLKQGIAEKGHLAEVSTRLEELNNLHNSLLTTIQDKDYQNQYAKLKDQLDKSGLKHIPFYGYQGHFADWKNSHLADIISCLESYIFGSQDRKKAQIGLNDAGPGWNFIPEWLIIGIMYE